MAIDTLASAYTPTRVADGAGGFTFSVIGPRRVYLAIEYHVNATWVSIRGDSAAVGLEDILQIEGQYYRVLALLNSNFANYYRARIEKTAKPIGV